MLVPVVSASCSRSDRASGARVHDSPHRRDQDALRAGQQWPGALEYAIRNARHFVLLIGPKTHESNWVRKELQLARKTGKATIIPVVIGANLGELENEFPRVSAISRLPSVAPRGGTSAVVRSAILNRTIAIVGQSLRMPDTGQAERRRPHCPSRGGGLANDRRSVLPALQKRGCDQRRCLSHSGMLGSSIAYESWNDSSNVGPMPRFGDDQRRPGVRFDVARRR